MNKIEVFSKLALASGKNILLVGAPGVGKTRLAKELAGNGMPAFEIVTCREGLTYDRLVAYYEVRDSHVSIELGPLARSLLRYWLSIASRAKRIPGWIVLDEVNRVNIDVVLGEIFTAMDMEHRMSVKILGEDLLEKARVFLDKSVDYVANRLGVSSDIVRDGVEKLTEAFREINGIPIPYSYRFIATMNIYDRAQLYRLGYAFTRRFAYIYTLPTYGVKNYAVTWNTREEARVEDDVGREVYALLTSSNSDVVRQAVRELEIHRHNKCVSGKQCEFLAEIDNPTIYFSTPSDLSSRIQEYIQPGSFCDKAFKLTSYIYSVAEKLGVELGISLLVDAVKMCIIANLAEFNKIVTDTELADFMLSSIVLPQLGVITPRLRAEALLGSEELLNELKIYADL